MDQSNAITRSESEINTRYDWINFYGNCVPELRTTIRKRGQKKDKEMSRKNQKKQKDVHGKMNHDKQKNTLGSRDNHISSQSQKLGSIKGLY